MKLKQKELKKTMRGIFAGACLLAIGSAVVFAVGTETEMKAYAAEWQQAENGDWTYAEDEGSHATGWQKIDGVWYYLNPDGSMAVGWIMDSPGQWYYLNSDGSMAADTVIDGCRLDPSGLWVE